MTYTVCNGVTHSVSYSVTCGVTNAVRTTVQIQNQIQMVVTGSCGVCGYDQIQSNGDLRAAEIGLG